MPLIALLATKHHFLIHPRRPFHAYQNHLIRMWSIWPLCPRASCVLESHWYIYQSSSSVRNTRVTEPPAASGDDEQMTGFMKLSARYGPLWLTFSLYLLKRDLELSGSFSEKEEFSRLSICTIGIEPKHFWTGETSGSIPPAAEYSFCSQSPSRNSGYFLMSDNGQVSNHSAAQFLHFQVHATGELIHEHTQNSSNAQGPITFNKHYPFSL